MRISPFRIERYYAEHEFTTRYMLSSSDCESRSVGDLCDFEPGAAERLLDLRCGYTESPGSPELRSAVAPIYETVGDDEVLAVSCAEEAIFLLYHSLLGPGDHAIVETPCYESALELARSTGAEVSEWRRRHRDGWAHDLDALSALCRRETKVIYVNQPHNPTGTLMSAETFGFVVDLARERGIVLFSDEVYRELEHDASDRLPAACDLSPTAVSLGSISKSYGLPGLRTGWVATHDARLRDALVDLKHYTTICSSAPSELLAALALRNRARLLERNLGLVLGALARLDDFFAHRAEHFSWVRPVASPIGFARVTGLGDVDELCARLAAGGVLLLPGSVYDEPEHVRIGYGRADFAEALGRLEALLDGGG